MESKNLTLILVKSEYGFKRRQADSSTCVTLNTAALTPKFDRIGILGRPKNFLRHRRTAERGLPTARIRRRYSLRLHEDRAIAGGGRFSAVAGPPLARDRPDFGRSPHRLRNRTQSGRPVSTQRRRPVSLREGPFARRERSSDRKCREQNEVKSSFAASSLTAKRFGRRKTTKGHGRKINPSESRV
jgi:hypothetical protein